MRLDPLRLLQTFNIQQIQSEALQVVCAHARVCVCLCACVFLMCPFHVVMHDLHFMIEFCFAFVVFFEQKSNLVSTVPECF